MSLASLGWSDTFKDFDSQIESLARIIAVHRSHLRAITLHGEINIHYSSSVTQPTAVGDWVVTTPPFIDEQNEPAALIKELIPRKSKIARMAVNEQSKEQVIAANIDTVFVVTSINQDFNLNRLQRYLLLIEEGGAQPVIILSKVDLLSYTESLNTILEKVHKSVQVIPASTVTKEGLDKIKALMPEGSTSVFVGSSGVGKSSLVNLLLNHDTQIVNEIRDDDGKGRHTTTSRQMFFIPDGGMIIDTPGIKEVSVFGSEEHLATTFSEVEELFTQCKYSDCKHAAEPGCAVLKALDDKTLDSEKWQNYLKLSKEIAFNNNKLSKQTSANSKKCWKQIQTDYKAREKFKKSKE